MKKSYLFLLLFGYFFVGRASIDTLRHYNPNKGLLNNTLNGDIWIRQYAKFYLDAPGYVKSIRITTLNTAVNGSVKVHIYGHNGGETHLRIKKDLITPVLITNSKIGFETLTIDLTTPLFVDGNQLTVAFDEFTGGIGLASSVEQLAPYCENSWGEKFWYYYQEDGSKNEDNLDNVWSDPYPCVIDLIMDYPSSDSPTYFKEITSELGIDPSISNTIYKASTTHAVGDYNDDGLEDLLIDGRLYRNKNGNFEQVNTSQNIPILDSIHSNIFIDINNDGLLDLLFMQYTGNTNGIRNIELKGYLNNSGNSFSPFSAIVLTTKQLFSSVNVADFNNDGYPDLFIGVFTETDVTNSHNILLYNDQKLGFSDESDRLPGSNKPCKASRCVDFNDDGFTDIYVCNYRLKKDELWRNNGDGSFTDVAVSLGLDFNTGPDGANHGTGVDWKDYDNDGDLDILVSRLAHSRFIALGLDHRPTTIYENSGFPDYSFTDLEKETGIAFEERHQGASWGDADNDGRMDLFTSSSLGCHYNDFYLQKENHSYENRSFDFGIHNTSGGNGWAGTALWIDYDKDGKQDILTNENKRIAIYKNTLFNNNNWISIKLNAVNLNKLALGARVKIYIEGEAYMQEVSSGGAHLYQNSNRLHFGLGNAMIIDSVLVKWPNGQNEKFVGLQANRYYELEEGGKISVGQGETLTSDGMKVNIYPNPSQNEDIVLSLRTPKAIEQLSISVKDILGREAPFYLPTASLPPGEHQVRLDISKQLHSGVYLLRIDYDGESLLRKFVIK